MSPFGFLSFFISYSIALENITVPPELYIQYFQSLNIKSVRFFLCENEEYKTRVLREMSGAWSLTGFRASPEVEQPPIWREGGVADLSCDPASQLMQRFSKARLLGAHTEWLLLQGSQDTGLPDLYALPSSCVTLAKVDELSATFLDLYRMSDTSPPVVQQLGTRPLASPAPLPPRPPRRDLRGEVLRTVAVILYPEKFDGFTSLTWPEADIVTKLTYPIAECLKEQFNFGTSMVVTEDYGWNDRQHGELPLLQHQEVDFGSGIFILAERLQYLEFTGDIGRHRSEIVYKQPPLSRVRNVFLLPFTLWVWLSVAGLCLLAALTLRLHAVATGEQLSLPEAGLLVIATITEQGMWVVPRSLSLRALVFTFSLSAVFLLTSYSANIVALLQSTSADIRTLDDLTNSRLMVKVQNVAYHKPMLENSQDKDVQRLYRTKILPQGPSAYTTPAEGIKLLRSGKYAFKVETHWGFKLIRETFEEQEKCALRTLRDMVEPSISIPVPKRSGYKELFSQGICWQREVGLLSRNTRRLLRGMPRCAGGTGRDYARVDMTAAHPPFVLLLAAALAALALVLLEILLSALHHRPT